MNQSGQHIISTTHEPADPVREADYEKAELDLLRAGLKRTHTERFDMMMKLIKLNLMMRNAKITHQRIG